MKKYITITEEVNITKLEEALCNMCSNSCLADIDAGRKALFGLTGEVKGSYNSPALKDITTYKFDICEHCLINMFSKFKIPVEEKEYSILDELYGV